MHISIFRLALLGKIPLCRNLYPETHRLRRRNHRFPTSGIAIVLALTPASCLVANPLKIVNAQVQEMEDGPPLAPGTSFVPGETVHLSFQVDGYRVSPEQKVHLSYRIDAFDPKGTRIVEPVESSVDTDLSPQDTAWKPKVRQSILIPAIAPPGNYRIALEVKDDLDNDTATQVLPFAVGGQEVPTSPTLAIVNFGFYHAEEELAPMETATYHPGGALWAKFDIVGYKFGERNTVDVTYGVAVLASGGKSLYSQPEAAIEKSFSFYPKPFVPGSMNLSLQPNMRPGEYTIVLTVRDAIGRQSYETKQTFRVE